MTIVGILTYNVLLKESMRLFKYLPEIFMNSYRSLLKIIFSIVTHECKCCILKRLCISKKVLIFLIDGRNLLDTSCVFYVSVVYRKYNPFIDDIFVLSKCIKKVNTLRKILYTSSGQMSFCTVTIMHQFAAFPQPIA